MLEDESLVIRRASYEMLSGTAHSIYTLQETPYTENTPPIYLAPQHKNYRFQPPSQMAAVAATVGAYLGLVGPLSTAVTQLISLSSQIPAVSNFIIRSPPGGLSNNVVKTGIGMLEGGDQNDFGGDGLNVNTFTGQGTFISSGKAPHMNQGQTYGIPLDASKSSVGDVQAWQSTISTSGADAVCVQYVDPGWMGTLTSGFDGTWGKDCGQDWYWSKSTWGTIQSADGNSTIPYRPACWWMDNVSKEHKTQSHPN